jgi:hypothetical protein
MSAVPAGVACSQKQNTKQKLIEELRGDVFRVRQDVRREKLARALGKRCRVTEEVGPPGVRGSSSPIEVMRRWPIMRQELQGNEMKSSQSFPGREDAEHCRTRGLGI